MKIGVMTSQVGLVAALVFVTQSARAHDGPEPKEASGSSAPAPAAAEPAMVTVAGETTETKDEPVAAKTESEKKEPDVPFRGSVFFFDQSMTTQTAHADTSPQLSYVPLYEWWFSFRPRWYFTKANPEKPQFYVSGRWDMTKELTNNQPTDNYREDVFGDVWLNAIYQQPLLGISKGTSFTIGPQFLLPVSKESQANGYYVQAGITTGLKQVLELNGESASALNNLTLKVGAWYNHPFSQATTPVAPFFGYTRQDTEGRTFISDQVRGSTLTNHSLLTSAVAALQVTKKFAVSLSGILINKWHYAPKQDATVVPLANGSVSVPPGANDQQHTVDTWMIASLDYDLIDELSLSLGYYNLASELAPNGQRRGIVGSDNIWWSPDARFFFTITANLDAIYLRATGGNKTDEPKKAARLAPPGLQF
jgi:hypothetical protein